MTEIHQRALANRASSPAASGDAAAAAMANEVTGGNDSQVVSAVGDRTRIEVVVTVGATAITGGGLSYEQSSVGACVRVVATVGQDTREPGERDQVRTTAVRCPRSARPTSQSYPVDETTRDVESHLDPVPTPEPGTCFGTSGDCPGG